MEAQFRPYSIVSQLSTTDASSIALKDTSGTALKANFISVEASGENPDSFFRVAIDSASQTTKVANYVATSATIGTTSGIVGGYASVNKGVVELLLADCDRTDTIQIQLDENGICNFFITYGQVQAGNRVRDNNRPVGN
tara:strand:+ start:1590 stop:2006 length:417 start_codon:yes stop_codon:yes gene_type:complete